MHGVNIVKLYQRVTIHYSSSIYWG